MIPGRRSRTVAALVLVALLPVLGFLTQRWSLAERPLHTIALIVPDALAETDPRIQVWVDAAEEEGLLLRRMPVAEFLRPWTDRRALAAVILPDQVHTGADSALLGTLARYVEEGGQFMLVYDAVTRAGDQPAGRGQLARLAGVEYGLYSERGDGVATWGPVLGSVDSMERLTLPPGKYTETGPAKRDATHAGERRYAIAGYGHRSLNYPSFVTRGAYRGERLLETPAGNLVAGYQRQGRGGVLFVNLPLGHLAGQSDGLPLHGFLRYLADEVLRLPYLAPVPEGVGGIVMNWHLDSNATIEALTRMRELGVYRQGPYSIHLTAGPDARAFGDGLGLDVPRNAEVQRWIRELHAHRHAIGSHGGWIHDYFGLRVSEHNRATFEKYLELNRAALVKASGGPVREYSSPGGNHPRWITDWLAAHGFVAYYYAGDSGMGPTRASGPTRGLWVFPVASLRDMASFEEFAQARVPQDVVQGWLSELTGYCAQRGVVRLVYFHPPGALRYPQAMRAWLAQADRLQRAGAFRWYTMTEIGDFLNARAMVHWSVQRHEDDEMIVASHPRGLRDFTWLLPKSVYRRPTVLVGAAAVHDDPRHWRVVAGSGVALRFATGRKES
jgi:hypothetical protein